MSLMKYNNLSVLTYGALGLTGIILAIATVYDSSDAPLPEPEPEVEPFETPISNILTNTPPEPTPLPGMFSNNQPEQPGGVLGNTVAEEPPGAFKLGGKKKKRKTKRHRGPKSVKKSRKTKHRKPTLTKTA